jgi:hypothetical protein
MIEWLADHVTLLCVLLGLVALACFAHWWLARKRIALVGVAITVVLMGLLLLLSFLVVTDRQQLVNAVNEMEKALQQRKLDKFFEHVSESFQHGHMGKKEFQTYVAAQAKHYKLEQFRVFGVEAGEPSRSLGKAKVELRIRVEDYPPVRCESEFVFEKGRWLLRGFTLFFPVNTDNRLELPP